VKVRFPIDNRLTKVGKKDGRLADYPPGTHCLSVLKLYLPVSIENLPANRAGHAVARHDHLQGQRRGQYFKKVLQFCSILQYYNTFLKIKIMTKH